MHKSDWKFYTIGAIVIVTTCAFSFFGVRASLYAIDCNQRETMVRIEQQANRMQAMQASMDTAALYGQTKPNDEKQKSSSVDQPSESDGKHQKDPFAVRMSKNGAVDENQNSVVSVASPDEPKNRWEEPYTEIHRNQEGQLSYVIQSGDTMMKIAKQFGFSVTELAAYNHVVNADRIYVGEQILFPEDGPSDIGDPAVGLG